MTLTELDSPWLVKLLDGASMWHAGWLYEMIGEAPKDISSELSSRDFSFLTRGAIAARAQVVAVAEGFIDRVPSMGSTVRAIVGEVFLLNAPDEFDVSHSEPRWPNWIFVSAPSELCSVSGLRLAENVVHEAMHLQLTALEGHVPLVADTASKLASPWKQEPRDLQGILHGLYVFTCISAFFDQLLDNTSMAEDAAAYIGQRRAAIREEIAAVSIKHLANGMTDAGRQFLEAINSQPPLRLHPHLPQAPPKRSALRPPPARGELRFAPHCHARLSPGHPARGN